MIGSQVVNLPELKLRADKYMEVQDTYNRCSDYIVVADFDDRHHEISALVSHLNLQFV